MIVFPPATGPNHIHQGKESEEGREGKIRGARGQDAQEASGEAEAQGEAE